MEPGCCPKGRRPPTPPLPPLPPLGRRLANSPCRLAVGSPPALLAMEYDYYGYTLSFSFFPYDSLLATCARSAEKSERGKGKMRRITMGNGKVCSSRWGCRLSSLYFPHSMMAASTLNANRWGKKERTREGPSRHLEGTIQPVPAPAPRHGR